MNIKIDKKKNKIKIMSEMKVTDVDVNNVSVKFTRDVNDIILDSVLHSGDVVRVMYRMQHFDGMTSVTV